MKISEGVEWAAHCCLLLDWMGVDGPVSTARLAAGYGLPPAYLNKQLQPLVKAGILTSTAGKKGGFRLAKSLKDITLMDVFTAIDPVTGRPEYDIGKKPGMNRPAPRNFMTGLRTRSRSTRSSEF